MSSSELGSPNRPWDVHSAVEPYRGATSSGEEGKSNFSLVQGHKATPRISAQASRFCSVVVGLKSDADQKVLREGAATFKV